MANIKSKELNKLETWNAKELRKLRMTLNNRISSLETSPGQKELSKNHPLFELSDVECKELLKKVMKAELTLSKQ